MTPPGSTEDRSRVLLTACGFGLAALAAVGALLLLGLKHHKEQNVGYVPRKAPVRNAADSSIPPDSSVPRVQAQRTAKRRSQAISAEPQGRQLFSPTSFWNDRLATTAPLEPGSGILVQSLVAEVQRERSGDSGPLIQATASSTPVYQVEGAQPRVRVRLDTRNRDGATALQRAFEAVPIPRGSKPAVDESRDMTIWQPSTDTLWELAGARKLPDGWHARWGGAIRKVSESRGYFTGAAWRGATRNWGANASSLPLVGGTILLDELKEGRIDHAIALDLPTARAGIFSWPAQGTDGDGPASTLPEGARLRLDPALDVRSLHLPRLTRMIAVAAQRYGFVVRTQSQRAISLPAESPSPFPGDPYRKYFLGRTPQRMLVNFPWDHLRVLKMHLCATAPCTLPS
jgi:hypothetical protein